MYSRNFQKSPPCLHPENLPLGLRRGLAFSSSKEYDALAVAIGSALKKFAPAHEAPVVHSLAEAEVVAKKTQPELFIVDFDPPQSGIVAFLNKMKLAHVDARLLVIAAGTSRDIAAMRGLSGAIQFIEKPFEACRLRRCCASTPRSMDGARR